MEINVLRKMKIIGVMCSLFRIIGHNRWKYYVFDGSYTNDRTVQTRGRRFSWVSDLRGNQ